MRTLSAAQAALLAGRARTEFVKVEIDSTGGGVFVDLCNLDGRDFVLSGNWGEESDTGPADAQIVVQREHFYRTLSPLMATSIYTGYIDLGRIIRIHTAVMPLGVPPQSSDFELMFSGNVVAIDLGGKKSLMKLGCLDDAGVVQDAFIEVQNIYGTPSGDDIENVMQDILDDHVNTSPGVPYTLNVPSSPGFATLEYQQTKTHVMEALRTLADLVGWDVRMRFDSGSGTFKLTLFVPDRSPSGVDHTFNVDTYNDITKLSQTLDAIRNAVAVIFENSLNNDERTKVTVTDAGSISQFGRRYMEITEGSSSQIDTPTEATAMATAAVNDLKLPGADQGVSMPYFWPAEVGDFYRFEANGVHYDSDLDAGVSSVRHSFTQTSIGTVLATRGKPATGVDRWLAKEARAGNAPGANLLPPDAAGTISATPGVGSVLVQYDEPTDPEWATSEVYADTSAISVPTYPAKPSPTLLVASGRTNKFAVTGLTPRTQYHFLILTINNKGEWISSTSQIQVATQEVGPYHENLDGQQDQLLRNNDFNVYTLGTALMPDRWDVVTGTYASGGADDTIFVQTVDHRTGDRALDFFYGGTANSPLADSDYVPFQDSDILRAAIVARMDTGGTNTDPQIRVSIRFADEDKVTISTSNIDFELTTSYLRFITPLVQAPADTRYVKLLLSPLAPGDATTDFTLQVDKGSLIRGKGVGASSEIITSYSNTFTKLTPTFSSGTGVSESAGVYTFTAAGQWRIRVVCQIVDDAPPISSFHGDVRVRVTTGGSTSTAFADLALSVTNGVADQVAIVIADGVIDVNDGDTAEVQAKHDQASGTLGGNYGVDLTQIFREETS